MPHAGSQDPTDRPALLTGISNAERLAWQRQAHALLGKLLELAAKTGLPATAWTVHSAGATLHGQVLALPDSKRREEFRAWLDAITVASGPSPDHDRQHDLSGDETRLVAQWVHLPVRPASRAPATRACVSP